MESSSPDISFSLCHTSEFLKHAFRDSSARNTTFFCQDRILWFHSQSPWSSFKCLERVRQEHIPSGDCYLFSLRKALPYRPEILGTLPGSQQSQRDFWKYCRLLWASLAAIMISQFPLWALLSHPMLPQTSKFSDLCRIYKLFRILVLHPQTQQYTGCFWD